jgi:hypothetical protein
MGTGHGDKVKEWCNWSDEENLSEDGDLEGGGTDTDMDSMYDPDND